MIEQYLNPNPSKAKAGENNPDFLLSLVNEPLVQKLMNNGALGYLDDLRDVQTDNFNNGDLASIIAQIFTASIIAYKLKEVIDAKNPITNYTAQFGILEEVNDDNIDCEYWFAEQSALWVLNEYERNKRPYWADLLTYIHKDVLSNDPYEIDRYDGLLLDLMDGITPANGTFDYKSLLADSEISDDEINLLSSSSFYNQSVMQNVVDKAVQYDISMTYPVLVCLHDIVVITKNIC